MLILLDEKVRGDGANQGIMDISALLSNILPLLTVTPPASLPHMKAADTQHQSDERV